MSDLPLFHTKTNELESKVALLTEKLTTANKKVKSERSMRSDAKKAHRQYKNEVAARLIKIGGFTTIGIAHVTGLSSNDIEIIRDQVEVFGEAV